MYRCINWHISAGYERTSNISVDAKGMQKCMSKLGMLYFDSLIRANPDAFLEAMDANDDVKNLLLDVAIENYWLDEDFDGFLDNRLKLTAQQLLLNMNK